MSENPPPFTSEDERWEELARDIQFTQLETIRATAEKWRQLFISLVALVATVSAIGGPWALSELSPSSQTLAGVCLVGSIVALLASAILTGLASFGLPEKIQLDGRAYHEWVEATTEKSFNMLRASLWFFGAGILLLVSTLIISVCDTHSRVAESTTITKSSSPTAPNP